MKNHWWLLLAMVLSAGAAAKSCDIEMSDLSESLQSIEHSAVVVASERQDPNSGEAIRRYVLQLTDGPLLIVEQKHCYIGNVTITLLLPEENSIKTVPAKLAVILNAIPEWRNWFGDLAVRDILESEFTASHFSDLLDKPGSVTVGLNEVTTVRASSEANIRLVILDSETLPFRAIVSMYFGVGVE